jgi:hypothetical protein
MGKARQLQPKRKGSIYSRAVGTQLQVSIAVEKADPITAKSFDSSGEARNSGLENSPKF